jgi:hypothetical protein
MNRIRYAISLKAGVDIYVDWQDEAIPTTSGVTVQKIKEKLKSIKIYFASNRRSNKF